MFPGCLSAHILLSFLLLIFLQTEALPNAWEFLAGLLRFQQSLVSVLHLHLERKGLCTVSVLMCSTGRAGKPL